MKLARLSNHNYTSYWQNGLDRSREGLDSQGRQQRIIGLKHMEKSLEYYRKALQNDP